MKSAQPEMVQVFDADGNPTGVMARDEAESANQAISVVLVFIFDSRNRVWIQLRPQTKKHFPGTWDISVCGGITNGETPDQAAARELFEETGIKCDLNFVEHFIQVFPQAGVPTTRNSFLFVGVSEDEPRANDEVDEFRALHHDELRQHVAENPEHYTPSFLTELDKAILAYRNLVRL